MSRYIISVTTDPGSERIRPPPRRLARNEFSQAFRKLVGDLAEHLDRGEHVVIHCRMGIGRSSMLAAALLMAEGVDPGGAWSTLREARGLDVPDTPEQRAWVEAVMIST